MELGQNVWNADFERTVFHIGIICSTSGRANVRFGVPTLHAEQCLQLAQEFAPPHRDRLLEWADEWRRVAEELEELEPQEDQVQQ